MGKEPKPFTIDDIHAEMLLRIPDEGILGLEDNTPLETLVRRFPEVYEQVRLELTLKGDVFITQPIYTSTLSNTLVMEMLLYRMFVIYHRQNRRPANPKGHYYVAIAPDGKGRSILQLKQTATPIIDILALDNVRKIPANLLPGWCHAVNEGSGWKTHESENAPETPELSAKFTDSRGGTVEPA